MMKSYFVEGLQGAGKSTYVQYLEKKLSQDCRVYREGDYSPVELAWCAYLDQNEYEAVLEKYHEIEEEIHANTYREEDKYVVCYTRILTDIEGFHQFMEQYEIYNGNRSLEEYEDILLKRFDRWKGEPAVFECSILQNIVENNILFYEMSDDRIVAFYKNLRKILENKEYQILYLVAEDIRGNIQKIRRERSDENGNELWFPMMLSYLENSPYGKKNGLRGEESLIKHLEHRQRLEQRILKEVFYDHSQCIRRGEEIF